VAWTLKVFGHENVHVLNNFKKWVEEGYPTESGEGREPYPVDYPVPEMDESKVIAFEELRELAKDMKKEGAEEVQILDARSKGRWEGVDPEPREGTLRALRWSGCGMTNSDRPIIRSYPILHLGAHLRPPRSEGQDTPAGRQAS
jgi:3-mercaptopyruvate sulfurtransferase SseA